MKRYLLISLAATAICVAGQAVAADVDMSKLTCKDVGAMNPGMQAGVAAWISGFAHAKANNAMIDTSKMGDNMKAVIDFCSKNPDAVIMSKMDMSKM